MVRTRGAAGAQLTFSATLLKEKTEEEMKARNALTVILAFFMVLALACSAQARPFGPGFSNGRHGGSLDRLQTMLALKLTDAQQERMSSILASYQEQRENLWTQMQEARRNIREVLKATSFDEKKAREAYQSASVIREEIFISRAKMTAELKSVLTPEQINQLKERRARKFRPTEQAHNPEPQNPSE
jgi:Spy/CpxP family protein refolding chaperone